MERLSPEKIAEELGIVAHMMKIQLDSAVDNWDRERFALHVQAIHEAIQLVLASPAAQPGEPKGNWWISVEDRLPKLEQEVLAITHGWNEYYFGLRKHVEPGTSKESDWLLRDWKSLREPKVTHWMPLPEPPKEDKNSD